MTKKLLLIGGGHAHLSLLKKFKQDQFADCEVTLLNPTRTYYYSGMFSGYVEGIYQLDELEIDLQTLCEKAGIQFVEGTALSVDAKQKMVLTEKGDILNFDVLSFDIGTKRKGVSELPDSDQIFHLNRKEQIKELGDEASKRGDVVIVGGGAAGIELSFSIQSWKKKNNDDGTVRLISSSALYGESSDDRCKKTLKAKIIQAGIRLHENERVERIKESKVHMNGESVSYDSLLWMTGSEAPKLYKSSKLPIDKEGYLLVEDTLQVKQYPFIFGSGNGVTIQNHPDLPRNGVMAVRQGGVLWDNLKGFLQSGEGYHFQPQKRYLTILSTGERRAYLRYGSFCTSGKLAWKLKNKIDKKFMATFK
ncbi:FAD-dependent oxidoreductase [Pseudalkalibacillus berkeleyi]|uniref:FAD-dependent oxidoreductase n=1 Tax=Pseudalkalibacillus berkeleyi TaxID=1069813 RepID=A0ABS9H1J6_9BACL|nr:FAD-dependent oxidoreductase [Pseudalkalibacillus berkeleyi]MCF6137677.1 FAD-dependent oxidoreductase [Pseudalkalibacillus berkeleyi]